MSTTFKKREINTKLLKTISEIAKKQNISEKRVLNDAIEKGLEKIKNETVKDKVERLALNTKRVNQNKRTKKTSIDELIGMFETEKPINPVEARKQIYDM